MNPSVYYTCSLRGCAHRATHLYSFTFQNRPHHQYNCDTHYQRNLTNDAHFDQWLDSYLDPS